MRVSNIFEWKIAKLSLFLAVFVINAAGIEVNGGDTDSAGTIDLI
jgi:hypothetical protein